MGAEGELVIQIWGVLLLHRWRVEQQLWMRAPFMPSDEMKTGICSHGGDGGGGDVRRGRVEGGGGATNAPQGRGISYGAAAERHCKTVTELLLRAKKICQSSGVQIWHSRWSVFRFSGGIEFPTDRND
jgi:hypothetical protein